MSWATGQIFYQAATSASADRDVAAGVVVVVVVILFVVVEVGLDMNGLHSLMFNMLCCC